MGFCTSAHFKKQQPTGPHTFCSVSQEIPFESLGTHFCFFVSHSFLNLLASVFLTFQRSTIYPYLLGLLELLGHCAPFSTWSTPFLSPLSQGSSFCLLLRCSGSLQPVNASELWDCSWLSAFPFVFFSLVPSSRPGFKLNDFLILSSYLKIFPWVPVSLTWLSIEHVHWDI